MNAPVSPGRTYSVVVPVREVRPSIPVRDPEQIVCHPAGHTTLASTAAHVVGTVAVVATVSVRTAGFGAAVFDFAGGAFRFVTRRFATRVKGRRARVTPRRLTTVVVTRVERGLDVVCRVATGAISAEA